MSIIFDRGVCCDLNETISREWLVTNGLGGYAAGTIAGVLTRMHHGLLVASPLDTASPQLLVAKIDEEVVFDQRTYYLGTNEYRDGILNPSGFVHLETFRLEEGFPIFTYRLGGIDGIMLEKRIWMPRGSNTTCVQYRVLRTFDTYAHDLESRESSEHRRSEEQSSWDYISRTTTNGYARHHSYTEAAQHAIVLTLLPFSAYRPHHLPQYGNKDWHFQVHAHPAYEAHAGEHQQLMLPKGAAGCTIHAWDGAHPYHILAAGHPESQVTFIPTGVWYWGFLRRHDQAAGLPPTDDLYLPGVFRARLWPGEDAALTIIASAEELSEQMLGSNQLNLSYKRAVERQLNISHLQRYFGEGGETVQQLPVLSIITNPDPYTQGEKFLRLLLQAGDHFLARRISPRSDSVDTHFSLFNSLDSTPVVFANYFNMEEYTRDSLIALPGLMLATGRYDEARRLLRGFARFFKQGVLPDRLPTQEHPLEESDYGSVDTTLWYFYSLDYYFRIVHDYKLLDELFPRLTECINWYMQGTFNGIRVDNSDSLLYAQWPGKALTWMNATINHVPITPRHGKPVEVNALWYHALSLMHEWSQYLYRTGHINYTTLSYQEQSLHCKQSFQQRFWYASGNYLYDVIDGPDSNDTAFRPNQLLALSLRNPILDCEYQSVVFDLITQHLLTPLGLRTLAPHDPGYLGRLQGNLEDLQRALHQGSVWSWLIGPYVDAWLNMYRSSPTLILSEAQDKELQQEHLKQMQHKGLEILELFRKQISEGILGMIGSTFSGDAPHDRGYKAASALTIGEILRVYNLFAQVDIGNSSRAFSIYMPASR
jgi:glycogen debranching enzyme